MRIRILALALVLAILPTTGELLELVVHWAQHGDVAHQVGDDHGSAPLGTDEHGCSGTFHLCPCHTAQATTPPSCDVAPPVTLARRIDALGPVPRLGLGAPAPSFRPPIV